MMSTPLIARDGAALSALQKLRFFPLAVTGGKGCTLIEEGGRELLDLSASWGAASLGHSHPAIRTAVERALANQAGASILSGTNEPAVELAEMLLSMTPGTDDRRVWLGHSGRLGPHSAGRCGEGPRTHAGALSRSLPPI